MDNEQHNAWRPYKVRPFDGYIPHRNEKGDTLPNCCQHHKKIFERTKEWALSYAQELDAVKFAIKTTQQVAYTEHCILSNVSHENGYDIIAGYIEYNVFSYGSPKDYQPYIFSLFGFMKPHFPGDLRFAYETTIRLDRVIFMWYMASLAETDIYTFSIAYKKWYNIFPFELSIFKGLKENYDFFFELMRHDFADYTHETFIEAINDLTTIILSQINTLSLFEDGTLDEPSKVKLELIISERRLQLNNSYSPNAAKKEDFKRILKKWFKDEKKFIDDLTSLKISVHVDPSSTPLQLPVATNEPLVPPDIPIIYDEQAERIWKQLDPYKFSDFLDDKKLNELFIKSLLSKHSGEQFLPYSVALFHEIGFLVHFKDKFCKNKEDSLHKLSKIFEVDYRTFKGNVNVLVPGSKEDSIRYTSIKHLPTIKMELVGV